MGYRSQVAIVIEFTSPELAQAYLQNGLESYPELKEMVKYDLRPVDNEKYLVFEYDWVKWYPEYKDVAAVIDFYTNSVNAEGFVGYAFKRIGEEPDDIEEDCEGEHAWEYISTIRKLEVNI